MSNTIINRPPNCQIYIDGDNNYVQFGKNCKFNQSNSISIGLPDAPATNCKIIIGDNFESNGMFMRVCENGSILTIGNDCLFSSGINIWCSDTHSVLDKVGNLVNQGKHITIGNHVWIGMNATILKNTTIPDNSIIGFSAVASGNKYTEIGSVIVGNPGKVVKVNMNWDKMRPQQWLNLHNT